MPVEQAGQQPVRAALGQRDLDAGVGAVERGQHLRQPDRSAPDHGPDGDPAAHQPGQLVHGRAGALDRGQRGPGVGQHGVAGRGGAHGAAGAVQQLLPELPLQPADLRAHPGLGHVHPVRGAGEAGLLDHGDQVLQLSQLHNC